MEFYRLREKELDTWKISDHRKPLVLRGARQTGKTTMVRRFGKNFDTYIELNLEREEDLALFDNNYSVKELIQYICLEKKVYRRGSTLLFIDEIQNSARAVSLLRFFYEDLPEIYVISAGSLLEIMMEKNHISFPVGRVTYMYLYPMNFREFLIALGENTALEFYDNIPCDNIAHHKLSNLFKLYTYVGGMPEAVSRYVETHDLSSLIPIFNNLQMAYQDDVHKYASTHHEEEVIRHVIESAPLSVGNRIVYEKFGNSNYSSKDISSAMRTLERAMLLSLRYPVTNLQIPLIPDKKMHPHLHYLDTGMLINSVGITSSYFSGDNLDKIYQGKLAEHIVGQEMYSNTFTTEKIAKLYFWTREKKQSNAELDFVYQYDDKVIPIEVKAGANGSLRSLHSCIINNDCDFAIRFYSGEISLEKAVTPENNYTKKKNYRLLNLPLYLSGQVEKYVKWAKNKF